MQTKQTTFALGNIFIFLETVVMTAVNESCVLKCIQSCKQLLAIGILLFVVSLVMI